MCDNNDNIIIEDRGIIVGIMYYILKRINRLFNKIIVIHDKRIRDIIKYFFYDLNIKKAGDGFQINIRNNNHNSGLIINNLNNLPEKIHAKKVYYLLWFNKDNPIVMYEYEQNKIKDKNKIKKDFDNFYRTLHEMCKVAEWNVTSDNDIIKKFTKRYIIYGNTEKISNYISCYVNNYLNCEKEIMMVPYILEKEVKKDHFVYVPVEKVIEKKIESLKLNDVSKDSDKANKNIRNFVEYLTNKFETLSDIIDEKKLI
jgi:hypothetical protein